MLLLNGVWGCFGKEFNGLFVLLKSVAKLKDIMKLHVIRTSRYYALQSKRYFMVLAVCFFVPYALKASKETRRHMHTHSDTPISKKNSKSMDLLTRVQFKNLTAF